MKVADRKREVYKLLVDPKVKTIVLYGKAGVGKTWTARGVTNVAKQRGLFDIVLWVHLNRKYDNDTLRDCIAQQLFPLRTRGVSEVDNFESKKEEVLTPDALLKEIENKKLIIVLDDEGYKRKEQKVMGMLNKLLELDPETHKVFVTTRNIPSDVEEGRKPFKVEPMVREESLSLLIERAISDHDPDEVIKNLAADFIHRTEYMPNAIIMMAKAFKFFSDKKETGGMELLRRSLEEVSDSKIYNITDLLRNGYNLVPYSLIIDCQRDFKVKHRLFFNYFQCINHNKLIAYWIMEGYLGPVSCMDTVYRKGHEILLELLDFQILKRIETDYVILNRLNPLRDDYDNIILRRESSNYLRDYYANACLGLNSVFGSVEWKHLERILYKEGVMRTFPCGKDGEKVSALLIDGNSLAKELPSTFISSIKEVQVLAIFNPTMDILSSFSDDIIRQLHVFVLRSCRFIKDMDRVKGIESFTNLTVLEISGLVDLFKTLPHGLFEKMPKLQSLNLSSLPFTFLPPSFGTLCELKWLILRDCTSLWSLESLRGCKNLLVLDCSGSTSLNQIVDRSFVNPKLEMINLSRTNILTLPHINNLKELTHLLLCECPLLTRLSSIKKVTSLEVLDLSNSGDFNEFLDISWEKLINLKFLDLSGTGVSYLPDNIGNPQHLCLESCNQLREEGVLKCLAEVTGVEHFVLSDAGIQSLPPISHFINLRELSVTNCFDLEAVPDLSSLEKIEKLDFSGCKSIKSLPDKTFDKMSRLRKLNLSSTRIESLPSLENLSNLNSLLLKDCKELKTLPSLESKSLEKLENLNIDGGKALKDIPADFFHGAINLRILNLSTSILHELPSLSKLQNLRELHLRNCKGLESISGLETITTLEILDLSGSAVSTLPILSSLSKLRKLMLHNCSGLSLFRKTGTLSILEGDFVQNLPYGISGLTSLEHLDLPCMDCVQGDESKETKTVEAKSDGCEWGISSLLALKDKSPSVSVSGTQFLYPLRKDPLLWECILKKFHLCVYPIKELEAQNVQKFHWDDSAYRDIYLQNRNIDGSDDQRLLEAYGFPGYKPEGMDVLFSHANQILFIDNKFQVHMPPLTEVIQTLPSFLTPCDPNHMKGCWIEKCRELEVIFSEQISEILGLLNSVETLWISNTMGLKSICKVPQYGQESPEDNVFHKLEKLYLECCPNLSSVLSLSQLPQKLKILQIKFCDKLKNVFEPIRKTVSSCKPQLKYLETLHLWELAELENIGCQLPSLKTVRISNCPNLQKLEKMIKSAESLQNLSISYVSDLLTIGISKELKYLSIESCPNLLKIFTLSQPPSDLEMNIRYCDSLETVFDDGSSLEIKLNKLHLHGLPRIRSMGATLPNQANLIVVGCPNLKIDVS